MTNTAKWLQPRDLQILLYLHRYRIMKSRDHLVRLFDSERILRRLQKLAANNFVYRFPRKRAEQQLYGLGNEGAQALEDHYQIPQKRVDWNHKNASLTEVPHTVLIADIMVGLELSAREIPGVSFIGEDEIVKEAPAITRTRYSEVRRDKRFEVITRIKPPEKPWMEAHAYPDSMFGLMVETPEGPAYRYFVLEADRATMPLASPNFNRPSILKKMMVYREAALRYGGKDSTTVFEDLYRKNFRGLFVIDPAKDTPGTKRVDGCVSTLSDMTGGKGSQQFLFADRAWLTSDNLLTSVVTSGTGTPTTLLTGLLS